MRVLLHICCAPCSIYPVDTLRREGHELRGFFYNPNIHPLAEFQRRLATLEGYAEQIDLPVIYRTDYPLEEWLRAVVYRENQRCRHCYHTRLSAAARLAKKSGFEAMTSTLLYSKLQRHRLIDEIGRAAAREAGIEWLYRDFRAGWAEGRDKSKELGLYRQQYCGCIYSERDRYQGRPIDREEQ